jgi:hypothetical protein
MIASLTASIIYMAYTATIVSVLSVERVPIKSLDDLYSGQLKIYASSESATLRYYLTVVASNKIHQIKNAKSASKFLNFKSLYKNRPELKSSKGENPWLPMAEGIRNIFKTPMAFLSYSHLFHLECLAHGISDRERCEKIYNFPITSTLQPSGMTLSRSSPLRDVFNYK